jgi:hypothetical protein
VLQAWNAAEKKYGLPQGMLLTLLGMENSGGRNLNRNPQSSGGAEGIFQFTRDLRKEYNIPDSDLRDPIKMGDWAARNMRRNADAFTKLTGQKLGNTQDDVLDYALLHQFGIGDGPRIVAATRLNPDMRMSDAMLKLNGRDNYRVLVNNGIPGNASVKAVVDSHGKRIAPWQSAAIKLQDNPEATSSTATTAPPSAGGDDGGDASTFLDSRSRGARIAGLDPVFTDRLAAAAKEAEEATGHRIQINSGHRTTAEQADIFRRSGGGRRFLAAPPGRSRHESGAAADIAHGPALDWLHQNRGYIARKYGIDFLRGRAFGRDPVHVQMIPGRVDPNVRFFKPTQVAQEAPKPPELPSMRGTDNLTQYSQPSAPIATADVFGGTRTNPQVMADIPLPRSQPDVATPDIPDAAAAQAKPQPTQELERPQVNPTVQAQPQSYVTDDEARAAMQRPGQPGAGVQAVGSAMQSIRELARKYARGGTGEDTRNVTADEAQRVPSTALQAGEPDNPFMPVDRPMVSVGTLLDKFSAQPQRDIPAPRGAELYGQPSVPRPDERYAPPVAQYSPGQLDPDTIRQMEEMILNRRSEATPPDTRGSVIDNVRDFLNKMYVGGGIENEMGYFGQENIPTAAPKVVAPKPIPVAPPRSVKTLAIGPNGEVLEPEVEQQPLGPAFVPKKQQGAPPPVTGPIPMAPAPGAGGAAPKPQGIQRIPDPNNPGKFIYRTPDETQFMEGDDGQFPLAELDPLAEEVTFG